MKIPYDLKLVGLLIGFCIVLSMVAFCFNIYNNSLGENEQQQRVGCYDSHGNLIEGITCLEDNVTFSEVILTMMIYITSLFIVIFIIFLILWIMEVFR